MDILNPIAIVLGIGITDYQPWINKFGRDVGKVAIEYSLTEREHSRLYLNLEHISVPSYSNDRGINSVGIEWRYEFK